MNCLFTPIRRPRSFGRGKSIYADLCRWSAKMSLVLLTHDERWLLFDPVSLHGRAQSFHVLLCRVIEMDAEFPGDPLESKNIPAHSPEAMDASVPPCRSEVEWAFESRCMAGALRTPTAPQVDDYDVVSIAERPFVRRLGPVHTNLGHRRPRRANSR